MRAIAILSHVMDENGILGNETTARVLEAVQRDRAEPYDYLLTSGWAYRSDSDIQIGEAVAQILRSEYSVCDKRVIANTHSRDTVGDAFFLREHNVLPLAIKVLDVVTSDYHAKRTQAIFQCFFSADVQVNVIGVDLGLLDDDELIEHEQSSLKNFYSTFDGVDFSSNQAVLTALSTRHPFYNGDIHSRI